MSAIIQIARFVSRLYNERGQLRPAAAYKLHLARQAGLFKLGDEAVRTAVNLFDARKNAVLDRPPELSRLDCPYPVLRYLPEVLAGELGRRFPSDDLQLLLIDKKSGLLCSQLPITQPNQGKIERARQKVIEASRHFGYEGFSEEIDRGYDPNSAYFIVENKHGEIVAAARMSRKTDDNRMPLEDGSRPAGSHYSLLGKEERAAEINSFFYRRKQSGEERQSALKLLFATLGRYSWLMGFEQVYCLADAGNKKTQDLYLKAGFKFSERFNEKIHFPTFGHTKDEELEPIEWTVLEMSRPMIILHALKGSNYLSI